jgi:glycosyltransferase involved in cell wall biosynthesis
MPITGWWKNNLGQTTLASFTRFVPRGSRLRPLLDKVQEACSWRAFAWHKQRFQRRIAREFAGRWHDFDAAYVHGDPVLANQISRRLPTVLRLPGPVTAECAPLLRGVHQVCANGDALMRVRRFLGDHVVELPAGLDVQLFCAGHSSVRSMLGWGEHVCVLGYVGRLAHLKGIDLLAAAFGEIVQQVRDVRLLLVGSGEQERHIRTVLAGALRRGLVHLEPDVDHQQLPQWYRAMDLMVMPSRYENHSNALLEAMGCGVPFLASDVGGNRTLYETGAGWLFESQSIAALRRALLQHVANRSDLKARGLAAANTVCRQHSWAATAERLETIFSSGLGVTR